MNLRLLPKELEDLINEFNVEHRPRMKVVLNELKMKEVLNKIRIFNLCTNCGCKADPKYTTDIFWCKYKFCSEWCMYDTEYYCRRNYRDVV